MTVQTTMFQTTRSNASHSLILGTLLAIAINIGAVEGISAQAQAPTPADLQARQQFLEVERFARLSKDDQSKGLPAFYREVAPAHLSSMVTAILSSCPANILDRHGIGGPPGDYKKRWADQLQDAAATSSPEDIADNLATTMWFRIASYVRTRQILEQNPKAVADLVTEDLDSTNLDDVKRGCSAVSELHLNQFTEKVLAIYLKNDALSEPAKTALIWLADPKIVRPLLDEVAKDPRNIVRHAGLFEGPLRDKPAEPLLVKLLSSPDPEIRLGAATALTECKDATLAAPVGKLAHDSDARVVDVALLMAQKLPEDAFATIRADLASLLDSHDQDSRLGAITTFAKHKDTLAGPTILEFLKLDNIDPGSAVRIMQAMNSLTGKAFGYQMHRWGPLNNQKAIAEFEAWMKEHPAIRPPLISTLDWGSILTLCDASQDAS
jgi:HEAT repeat protein